MSEVLPQEARAVPAAGASAGAMLRQAREAAGLHVAAMAVSMKVPVAKLEALEQDRHDLLPDAVFARALASAVCRTLKIDPRPVLDRLPQTAAPRLVQDNDGLNAPFRSPRDAVAPHWREHLTRPVSLAVAALLLGAAVVLLLPRTHFDDTLAEGAKPAAGLAPATAGAAAERAKPELAPEQPSSPIVPASMTMPATVPVAVPAPAKPEVAVAHAPAAAPAPVAATPPPAASAATGGGPIVFRASAQSWIEVRDAKGGVPLRKVLAAGEAANVSGAMPLQVVVGNVNATQVDVRGKPYDLKPLARDNVARFEVR
jgi:cytoskeleton protein RodZ